MNKRKWFVASMLTLAGTLGAGMAQARDVDVQWSVTLGSPGQAQPLPVYTPANRVYGVYAPALPVYVQPAPAWGHRHSGYQQPTRWDRDGDGIPNARDRLYNPVWDRDGDGIPNRQDRYDNTRHDRDGDGIPNRYDRRDGREWRGR